MVNFTQVALEFVGTFLFLYAILYALSFKDYVATAAIIGLALIILIYVGLLLGGASNYNPAITTVLLADKQINSGTWLAFIIAQILGALLALWVYRKVNAPRVQTI